ncbi:MAG: DnaJ domain-containing protein [Syntrophales bacterium]|nr:DnaJ domain-containing protein [Syntrophales bacterium]MDD5234433.1 DnaJ domain-containing protein [Syntrophales bacterium]MDD5532662.1 DnaJ domain-containing protein [Syntrophales bacterium]
MGNRNYRIDKARKLLGLPKGATAEDAKRTYRELAKIWHPDLNPDTAAITRMQDINKAYALLMKEEFGILDPWEEADRYWWQRFGSDPVWSSYSPEDNEGPEGQGEQRNLIKKKG